MSERTTHELLEVPDTPPDCLAMQNGGRLSRAVGARHLGSVCLRERSRDNDNISRRERTRTIGEKITLGSSNGSRFLGASYGTQYTLGKKDSFGHVQKHVHPECTASSSDACPQQYFSRQTALPPRQTQLETCNKMSREDKDVRSLNIDELFCSAQEEFKRNGKDTTSGHVIPTPIRNRRKMLVRNGRISPNDIATDATTTSRGVKRREAGENLEGSVMNEVSADVNSSLNGDQVLHPNGNGLSVAAQQDERKGKEIVSGDMVERGKDSSAQLLQSRKRMRANSSYSEESNRLSACTNDAMFCRSRDNASEGNIKLTCEPLGCTRIGQNERHSSRLEKLRGHSPSLSLVGDEGNSSEAASPEVIFLRSSRPVRRNISSTKTISNVQESNCGVVEVADHTPIDVDSLESTFSESVNLYSGDGEAGARARQIEQDEILARQLQEEYAGEVLEEGLQQDNTTLHSMVQREIREHTAASDSGLVFTGLRASFGIGARRSELTHSLRIHPSMPTFQAGLPRVSQLRRRAPLPGRMGRSSVRSFRERRFQFPPHMNIEMRVDMLEAMEHAVESNMTHQFLAGVQRDFNEDDYEMLLALDNDNDNHRGASQRHIDRLPVSTVQNDISDEVCSVCLEMPKSGEVIRHLLCTHKFHKECIDPWLEKQASCPICKIPI